MRETASEIAASCGIHTKLDSVSLIADSVFLNRLIRRIDIYMLFLHNTFKKTRNHIKV